MGRGRTPPPSHHIWNATRRWAEDVAVSETGAGDRDRREVASPRVKAIEAELWAGASPHEREAAMLVGQATDQQDLPHVLAALKSIDPKDAIEARLAALVLSLTHASAENLKT